MAKQSKKKKDKQQKDLKTTINKPMEFDELLKEIATVKPPKTGIPPEIT